jgi:hypothetical protein
MLALVAACSSDLNITNENDPDTQRALATTNDVAVLMENSFNTWWFATQSEEPGEALAVMADALTCSYGNFGMRFNSNEPRIAYANSATGSDEGVVTTPWNDNYEAIGTVNDGLRAIAGGVPLGPEYVALGYFIQGVSLGNIALLFDKGAIIDETTPVPAPVTFVPYSEVAAAAVAKLDKVIAMSDGADWKLPDNVANGLTLDAAHMNAIANTMAARILAYTPRNAAENAKVDWAKVAAYARKGISMVAKPFDFGIVADDNNWWDPYKAYANYDPWMRVDMRVMHELDPNQPVRFPSCDYVPPPINTPDQRVGDGKDFVFKKTIPFQTARGCYHFSNWSYARYNDLSWNKSQLLGPDPMVITAENDLLLAEADARMGVNLTEAAALVNKTRVGRGGLPAVAPNVPDLLAAIQYEQDIELMATGSGLQFYDRRRVDGLQPGTPHHLPVPATELETDGLPVYTFGGSAPNPVFPVE